MTINYWAVFVCAVASMIVGSVWYGPLFGKFFMREQGLNKLSKEEQEKMKKKMPWSYLEQFVASVVMFTVLDAMIVATSAVGVQGGISVSLLLWFGFVVTLAFGNTLCGGKMTLFWLNIGDMFVSLLVAGAIIGAWR